MSARKFRAEFLQMQMNKGWVSQRYLHSERGCPAFEVVFRDRDGDHYAMEYYCDKDTGIDTFEGSHAHDLYDCYEVEKSEVVTRVWKRK